MGTYNIDWEFISKLEGNELIGYQPDGNSGVTIASGVDLKEKDRSFFEHLNLPESLIKKLEPFFGLSGMEAKAAAPNLIINADEDLILNQAIHSKYADMVAATYEKYSNGKSFSDLSMEQQTVLASVGFQHGTAFVRKDGTPMNFIKQAAAGDWEAVLANLRNFGDDFNTRRNEEADYLIKKKTTIADLAAYRIQPYVRSVKDSIKDFEEDAQKGYEAFTELDDGFAKIATDKKAEDAEADSVSAREFFDGIQKPELWNLDYTKPYDKVDLDEITNITNATKRELREKHPFWSGEFLTASYKQDMTAKIFNQADYTIDRFMLDELKPDPDFVLTQEKLDELSDGLPDDFRDEFTHAHSEGHAQQIRGTLLRHLEIEDIIYSQGIAWGTSARILAALTDPASWAVILATEGLATPFVAVQKASRVAKILRSAGTGAVSIGAIMAYLASQRPDLDGDDVMHGIMTGALLGGLLGLRGYKKVKFNKDNDKAYNNLAKKFLDENNAKTMEEGGFVPPNSSGGVIRPTNNNPNPLKGDGSGERIFEWYDETLDLAASSRIRTDKRIAIEVTPIGKPVGTIEVSTKIKEIKIGDRIIVDSKGTIGIVKGINRKNEKMGVLNDNYVIKGEGTRSDWVLDKGIIDSLNRIKTKKVVKKDEYILDKKKNGEIEVRKCK